MHDIIHRPRRTAALSAVAALGCLAGGPALAADSIATNCRNTNTTGSPWRTVTQLTSSTPIGEVLQERAINLFVEYQSIKGREPHELVLSGRWTGVGYPQAFDAVRTNIDAKGGGTTGGIGFRVVYTNSGLGLRTTIPNSATRPLVLDKRQTSDLSPSQSDTTVATYLQQLILLTEPANLPSGELRVTSLGSAGLELGTTDTVKGALSVGGPLETPTTNLPPGVCRHTYTLSSAEMLNIGGGPPPPIVNKCDVETSVVPVTLGQFSQKDILSNPAWTSPLTADFKIRLSKCSAVAKPQIWFQDKNNPANTGETLSLAGAGATGIGIAMYTVPASGSPRRVKYATSAPGNEAQYKVERLDNSDMAQLTLRAQYVRTGDAVVKAGPANGTALFNVTYP